MSGQLPAGRRGVIRPGTGAPVPGPVGRGRGGMTAPAPSQGPMGRGGRGRGLPSAADKEKALGGDDECAGKKLDDVVGKMGELSMEPEQMTLARRPGAGTVGRKIKVHANYFPIVVKSTAPLVVQQYCVEVTHQTRKLTKDESVEIFRMTVIKNPEIFGPRDQIYSLAYDGSRLLFSLRHLRIEGSERNIEIRMLLHNEDRQRDFTVNIKHTGQVAVDLQNIHGDITEASYTTPLQVVDVVLRQARLMCENSPYVCVGRSFFRIPNPNESEQEKRNRLLGGGHEVWPGFFTATHAVENWLPMVNIDTSNTAFYVTANAVEFLCHVMGGSRNAGGGDRGRGGRGGGGPGGPGGDGSWDNPSRIPPNKHLNPVEKRSFEREAKGLKTEIEVVRLNRETGELVREKRRYKILGISDKGADELFFDSDGTQKSVADYVTERYGAPLRFPGLPCIQVPPKTKKLFYPLEKCSIITGQKCSGKLKDQELANMIRFATAGGAMVRKGRILKAAQEANLGNDQWTETFGLKCSIGDMAQVEARQLQAPKVIYARDAVVNPMQAGEWKIGGNRLYEGAEVRGYVLLSYLPKNSSERMLEAFCSGLANMGNQLGMRWHSEYPWDVAYIDDPSQVEKYFDYVTKEAQKKGNYIDLVICALNSNAAEPYGEVKRVAEIQYGIRTQCAKRRTIMQVADKSGSGGRLVASNYILKINAKCGGINNSIGGDVGFSKFLTSNDEPTIVIGVDLTHPGATELFTPSVASVVGSLNVPPTRYGSSIKVQKHRRDHIVYLTDAIRARLTAFRVDRMKQGFSEAQARPTRIVVLRDGISEGQFKAVLSQELTCIRQACLSLQENYYPKVTYIVCQKRHHVRLFPMDKRDSTRNSENVLPGTTVDRMIVHPRLNDYYQVSHTGIQGTARPTHYTVLHDDSQLSADEVQTITNDLTYVYVRCTRSTSLPAPVYYADLCCRRTRHHIAHRTAPIMQQHASSNSDEQRRNNPRGGDTGTQRDSGPDGQQRSSDKQQTPDVSSADPRLQQLAQMREHTPEEVAANIWMAVERIGDTMYFA